MILFLLSIFSSASMASLDNYSIVLLPTTTNPSGTLTLPAQDIRTLSGYSIQFDVTGTLSFTSTLWASNDPESKAADKIYSALSNSVVIINNTDFWYNNAPADYSYVKPILTGFSGTGTLKVIFTAKDI